MTEKQTNILKTEFPKCVVKKTVHYYTVIALTGCGIAITGCGIAIVAGIVYGLLVICSTILPIIATAIGSIPLWVYIPVGIIVIPLLIAIIVCYIRRNDNEIKKADEEYVCPE